MVVRRRLQIHESPLGWLGDIYCYRSAASSENDSVGLAISRLDEMIDKTLHETSANEFSMYLSGENNFRKQIYPEYKANRKQPKPIHLQALRDYVVEKYKAEISNGCEADDLLGITQCNTISEGDIKSSIICSIDKDLLQIPGMHYSFEIGGTSSLGKSWTRPMEIVEVSEFQGLKQFYTQLLTGDPSDNIKGAAGIGKVKAEQLLRDCFTEQDMFEAVESQYSSEEELLMNGQCLWIFRKENDRWRIPTFETS